MKPSKTEHDKNWTCELVGISARTYQRWNQGEELSEDQRIYNHAPTHNKLSDAVRQEILSVD